MNPIYESINIMSRIKTYILTSSCQIANHIMRLSFPFVQSNIIRFFSTNAAVLGKQPPQHRISFSHLKRHDWIDLPSQDYLPSQTTGA